MGVTVQLTGPSLRDLSVNPTKVISRRVSEQTSLQASPLERQHCSQSGDQTALNGAAVEQEGRV